MKLVNGIVAFAVVHLHLPILLEASETSNCRGQARFDILVCQSFMCTACSLAWCPESCQKLQLDFPGCKCSTWGTKASYSDGDFGGKSEYGDVGDYSQMKFDGTFSQVVQLPQSGWLVKKDPSIDETFDMELSSKITANAVLVESDWHDKRPNGLAFSTKDGDVLCEWSHTCGGGGSTGTCAWSPDDAISGLAKGEALGQCEMRPKAGGGNEFAMSYSMCVFKTPVDASAFTLNMKSNPCNRHISYVSRVWLYKKNYAAR
jgi:hypothetical protein